MLLAAQNDEYTRHAEAEENTGRDSHGLHKIRRLVVDGQVHSDLEVIGVRTIVDRIEVFHEGLTEDPHLHIAKLHPDDANVAYLDLFAVVGVREKEA